MLPTFQNTALFQTALTHRSALNESDAKESNERLEFLGDAVLELAVTDFLYKRFPEATEGEMTAYRSALVKTTTLATISKELGIHTLLKLSKGEERSGGRENTGLLADLFEAVTGALYLDQGYEAAAHFIAENVFPKLSRVISGELYKDYKTTLQELVQSKGQGTPTYETIAENGPDHAKTFTVEVLVDGNALATGTGKSKQDASQAAAREALEEMKNP